MKLTKVKSFKILMMLVGIVLLVGIIVYMAPVVKDLNTVEGQIAFRNKEACQKYCDWLNEEKN